MRKTLATLLLVLFTATAAVAAPRENIGKEPPLNRIVKKIKFAFQSLGEFISPPRP